MSNSLPFRVQAGAASEMPQPAGVIPPFSDGADRGPVPAGGEWPMAGESRPSNAGGVTFVPGFSADGSTGAPVQDFTQKPTDQG